MGKQVPRNIQPTAHEQLLEALRLNTEAQNRLAAGIEVQAMALHALADAIAVAASDQPEGEPEVGADVPRYMDGTPMPRGSTG